MKSSPTEGRIQLVSWLGMVMRIPVKACRDERDVDGVDVT